jgi:hypothetical protein
MDWMIVSSLWPVLLFLGGIIVWAIRAEARSKSNEVIATEVKAIAQRAIDDLTAFKERVAQEYVTAATLLAVREEIGGAINRLAERIDRILEARKT